MGPVPFPTAHSPILLLPAWLLTHRLVFRSTLHLLPVQCVIFPEVTWSGKMAVGLGNPEAEI